MCPRAAVERATTIATFPVFFNISIQNHDLTRSPCLRSPALVEEVDGTSGVVWPLDQFIEALVELTCGAKPSVSRARAIRPCCGGFALARSADLRFEG